MEGPSPSIRASSTPVWRSPISCPRSGKSVKIHTGSGNDDRNDLYWGSGAYIWNNDGDKATLKDDSGNTVDLVGPGRTSPQQPFSDPIAFGLVADEQPAEFVSGSRIKRA